MNTITLRRSIAAAQIILALVVSLEAADLLFSARGVRAFQHLGVPDPMRLLLGGSEIAAAILFIIPRTVIAGAWCMLGVFALAAFIHIVSGNLDVGSLVVYAAVVAVVAIHRMQTRGGAGEQRQAGAHE